MFEVATDQACILGLSTPKRSEMAQTASCGIAGGIDVIAAFPSGTSLLDADDDASTDGSLPATNLPYSGPPRTRSHNLKCEAWL